MRDAAMLTAPAGWPTRPACLGAYGGLGQVGRGGAGRGRPAEGLRTQDLLGDRRHCVPCGRLSAWQL